MLTQQSPFDMTHLTSKLVHSFLCAIFIPLFLWGHAGAVNILEATTGGASGTDWNQGVEWGGGAAPTTGNSYIVYTNTSNGSGLSSYYGVNFGTGYIRTPANGNASVFLGGSLIVPPGTEILLKELNGGSASANIIFTNYNNANPGGQYPIVRLSPNQGSETVTLNGTITSTTDGYLAADTVYNNLELNIASTVVGTGNITLVTSGQNAFSHSNTNVVTGDWSGFSGTLNIGNATIAGVVELNNSAVNVNLALAMPRSDGVLVLDKAISVKTFFIANNAVPAGTYTPAQLAGLGFGGTFSGSGSLTIIANSIGTPQDLTAISGNAQVALSWQPVYGSVSYNVKRSTASGAEMAITNVVDADYTDTGLVNGTTYFYEISAVAGSGGQSGNSSEVSATPNVPPNYPEILKVYLQGGQSNSDGRALTNGLPVNLLQPQADVPIYYYLVGAAANGDGTLGTLTTLRPGISALGGGTTFGPELTFGRTLADYYALTNGVSTNIVMVAIIKYADGGTSLVANWAANGNSSTNGDGPDYVIFQSVVAAGLSRLAQAYPAARIELDGMIWVQGESDIDAGVGASTAYGTNLVRFINDVRQTYATNTPCGTNLPFFLSRISANQSVYSLPSDSSYSDYLLLRAGQQFAAATMSNVFMIDTDASRFSTLTPWSSPGLHFDTPGQQSMGTAFGQSVIAALPPPQLQIPEISVDGFLLNFTGVSGTIQSIERSSSLQGPWNLLANILIGASGITNYDDPDPTFPAGFYRVSRP
jgi:hypothetical protein